MLNRPQLAQTCGQRSREQMDSALQWSASNLAMYKYRLDCSAQYDTMLAFLATHPTDEDFWEDAKVILPRRKEVVTIRLDADLLEWLRRQPGYQTRINAILRSYMKGH